MSKATTTTKLKMSRSAQSGQFVSTVSSKNQVTIPVGVREAAGIRAGSNVVMTPLKDGRIIIREKTGTIVDLRGAALKHGRGSDAKKSEPHPPKSKQRTK